LSTLSDTNITNSAVGFHHKKSFSISQHNLNGSSHPMNFASRKLSEFMSPATTNELEHGLLSETKFNVESSQMVSANMGGLKRKTSAGNIGDRLYQKGLRKNDERERFI